MAINAVVRIAELLITAASHTGMPYLAKRGVVMSTSIATTAIQLIQAE
jgi:hypothetical protein